MPSLYLIARTLVPVTMGCLPTEGMSWRVSGGRTFDELCALDSLSKGVLNDAGPLVNRVGSITIKSIVPLRMDLSVSKYKNQEKRADGATPVGWEVIHDVGTGGERASVCR